jgi:hypothetical protein
MYGMKDKRHGTARPHRLANQSASNVLAARWRKSSMFSAAHARARAIAVDDGISQPGSTPCFWLFVLSTCFFCCPFSANNSHCPTVRAGTAMLLAMIVIAAAAALGN